MVVFVNVYNVKIFILLLAAQPLLADSREEMIIQRHFQERVKESISPLSGGYSEAANYFVEVDGHQYVLRLYDSERDVQREFYALQAASNAGIGPRVWDAMPEERAVLMDFVQGKTITLSQARENIVLLAECLRKAHATEKNPHSRAATRDRIEQFYELLCEHTPDRGNLDEAMAMIREGQDNLPGAPRVNIHGDLNPRNIFLTENGIQLIDWSETNWEHPYYDLTCLALLHDFSDQEEQAFLEAYLQRKPTPEELRQYNQVKKIQLAMFYLNCTGVALKIRSPIDPTTPLQSWTYYVENFAITDQDLSAQFFDECARASLERARIL
jgi:aminoglycoside phosphotransferase (APT) family kinase protein